MSLVAHFDESYTQELFFLGCAVAEEENWERVDQKLIQLLDQQKKCYDLPEEAELHAHEILGGAGKWKPLRGKHREAGNIIKRALTILREEDVKLIFRGIDIARLNARYKPSSRATRNIQQAGRNQQVRASGPAYTVL